MKAANAMPLSDRKPRPSTIYGPVPSWRFGRSLGVDPILETSTCSFNCIYCQLGSILRLTDERRRFVCADQVRRDLAGVEWSDVDVVTISGSGEPTLAANLDEIVAAVREATDRPIHLLTNATLMERAEVRRQVAGVDVIACKLDAPDDAMLRLVNRPVAGITLERIVAVIVALREEFGGRLLLQVMLMPANIGQVERWAPLIERIRPHEIHLNTPRRPYPAEWRLESHGDHASEKFSGRNSRLRVISPQEAREAERALHERTGLPVVSVYGGRETGRE